MLMGRLKEPDFFKRPIPRSAWRLDFGSSYLDRQMAALGYPPTEDLLAAFAEFTADAITRSITDNVKMLTAKLASMKDREREGLPLEDCEEGNPQARRS